MEDKLTTELRTIFRLPIRIRTGTPGYDIGLVARIQTQIIRQAEICGAAASGVFI
jgi:hypothetical protein